MTPDIERLHREYIKVCPDAKPLPELISIISKGEGNGLPLPTLVRGYLEAALWTYTTTHEEKLALARPIEFPSRLTDVSEPSEGSNPTP